MKKNIHWKSLLGVFGCLSFETEVLEILNEALENNKLPDFSRYNEFPVCQCRLDECRWTEAQIVTRLKERGIWEMVENLLNVAKKNADGSIFVPNVGTFPYVGEYDNYRKMDADAKIMFVSHPNGYVCRVEHNEPNVFMLMLPEESRYIVCE